MVNTEIRLVIFFAVKDGEALYNQQKQDQELTVAQIMNSLTLKLPGISPTDRGHLHSALHTVGLSPLEPLTHRLPGISTTDRGGEAASSPSPQLVASP